MKGKFKSTKGITLIALIITIIILLILAAISIRIVLASGIIARAETAVGIHTDKEKEQNQTLDNLASWLDAISKKELDEPTEGEKTAFEKFTEEAETAKKISQHGDAASTSDFEKGDFAVIYMPHDNNQFGASIFDYRGETLITYIYASSEEVAKVYNVEKAKTWYISTNCDSLKEYTGASPLQISDFATDEIYSKSYLTKVIASFGTIPETTGKLTSLTTEEKAKCNQGFGEGIYVVGGINIDWNNPYNSEFLILVVQDDAESTFSVLMLDMKNNKQYGYTNSTQNDLNGTDTKYNIWLVYEDASETQPIWKKYTGSSPIQASDFTSGNIYCSSYLNKIIASFN